MGTTRGVLALTVLTALVAGTAAPAAWSSGPLVLTDVAGDANALALAERDVETAPASVAEADVLRTTVSTATTPSPRGPVPSALVVRLDLAGDPRSGPFSYGLETTIAGCASSFLGAPSSGTLRWYMFGDTCPSVTWLPGTGTFETSPAWTVTAGAAGVELRIPFASLTPAQAAVLRPGAVLTVPQGVARGHYEVHGPYGLGGNGEPVVVDATRTGADWEVASDVG